MLVTRVVSGGQTGADRAALDVAADLGLAYGGWCPQGGWAEDHPNPPGLLERYPSLREAPAGRVSTRTRWNVRDSDATLVLTLGDVEVSGGTRLTVEVARRLDRPLLVVRTSERYLARDWLDSVAGPVTLNVAGPRESEQPGLYAAAYDLLTWLLG